MIEVRRSAERGLADHGWLDSYHTFSFADYYDPAHMGFRAPARDQRGPRAARAAASARTAIATWRSSRYVLEGALAHKDSMGTGSVHPPGRRAAHERRHGRAPQRVQRLGPRAGAFPPDLDRPSVRGDGAGLRAEDASRTPSKRGRARASSPRPTGATASVTIHAGRESLCGAGGWRRVPRVRARPGPAHLSARRPRGRAGRRPRARGGRRDPGFRRGARAHRRRARRRDPAFRPSLNDSNINKRNLA